jgi:methionine aminopeptidase
MSINGPEELAGMRAAGAVVRLMLSAMKNAVREGITTAELDEVGAGSDETARCAIGSGAGLSISWSELHQRQ